MSRFKNQERVQIIATGSSYRNQYGTIIATDSASVRLLIDGESKASRFWDTELIPAPHAKKPEKELTRTQAYIRELDEDTKHLFTTAGLYPQGSTVQKDLQAYAAHQAKIVYNLKMFLSQDGVKVWETENAGK